MSSEVDLDQQNGKKLDAFFLGGLVTQDVFESIESARGSDPDWVWLFETVDPLIAEQKVVKQLHDTAPDLYLKGVISGILMMRESIALVTGRGF
jgi:hypothetical protein